MPQDKNFDTKRKNVKNVARVITGRKKSEIYTGVKIKFTLVKKNEGSKNSKLALT